MLRRTAGELRIRAARLARVETRSDREHEIGVLYGEVRVTGAVRPERADRAWMVARDQVEGGPCQEGRDPETLDELQRLFARAGEAHGPAEDRDRALALAQR